MDSLKNYAQTETIGRFVVGYPVNMDGTPSEAAKDVDQFLQRLEKEFPGVPVSLEDERFTSVLAHRVMVDGGMKAKDRRDKKSVDRISAAIILQGWLDRESGAVFAVDPDAVPESLSRNVTRSKKKRR